MDSTGLSYGSGQRQRSNMRNPSNPRDAKASQAVNDWASKKKEQLERARQLREERKNGSSHLKSAGETQLGNGNPPPSGAMRSSQAGRPGGMGGGQMQLGVPGGGGMGQEAYGQNGPTSNYNEYLQDNHNQNFGGGRQSPMYGGGGVGASMYDMEPQNLSYDLTPPSHNNRRQTTTAHQMQDQSNLQLGHQNSAMPGYSGGPMGGGIQTQANFRQNRGEYQFGSPSEGGNRLNTISHENNDPSRTQLSGGFPKNPLQRRPTGHNGGVLNQTADQGPRIDNEMRSTNYTKQDVQEARDGLQLLKSRMSGLTQKRGMSNSQSANRNPGDSLNDGGARGMPYNQSTSQIGADRMNRRGPRPPGLPQSNSSHNNAMNNSNIDTANTSVLSGPTPRNSNYRKAFKPTVGGSGNSVNQSNDQGFGNQNDGNGFYENPVQNRQQVNSYEPAKRSPNMPRRQLSTNQKPPGGRAPQQYNNQYNAHHDGGGRPGLNEESEQHDNQVDPFNNKGAGMMNSPVGGSRANQVQPNQRMGNSLKGGAGGGMSIYERAAMEADPNAIPTTTQPNAEEAPRDDGVREPCSTCGRKFNSEALMKHERICQKVFVQKRKAFDVKEQRKAEGMAEIETENQYNKPFGRQAKKAAAKKEPAKPAGGKIPKWKLQSMQFRQAMGAGNETEGGGGSNFNPSQAASQAQDMDDRIECKFCGRKFNEEAGKRHMIHCEEKYKKNLMKNGGKEIKKAVPKRGTQVGFRKQNF